MNRRKLIQAAVIAGILVIVATLMLRRTPQQIPMSGRLDFSPSPPSGANATPALSVSSVSVQKPGGPYESHDPRWEQWNEMSKRDPSFQWKMPIEFYGKVVDEKEQPIEGAKFDIVGTDASPTGNFYRTLISDANGMVSLNGLRGKQFGVLVSKDGYYTPQNNRRSFEYAAFFNPDYYEPDANNPVVFHLRKKGNAQPLICRRELRGFLPDGHPSYIDLVTGQKSRGPTETGDLEITIFRSPAAVKPFDWSVKLAAVGPGSGIVESTDQLMLEAPDQGYQQSIEYNQSANDPNWQMETATRFYIRSRNGQVYASVEATIMPEYQQSAAIDWQYCVNDTGSRNLESSDVQPAPAP